MKKIAILLVMVLMATMLFGCSSTDESDKSTEQAKEAGNKSESNDSFSKVEEESAKAKEPVTLTMLFHDNILYEYLTETHDINEYYQEVAPHVTIEIEKAKDSGQMEETIMIRYSANEMPDIMLIKPYMLADLQDALAPLNDTEAFSKNLFAEAYAVDGKVVGMPETAFYEFVYYRKSIFNELGIEVPTTWDQFVDAAVSIKDNSDYIPIALGAKDAWPDYPFNEFMPCLEAGQGDYWNVMAAEDAPFTPGTPFYESYAKIQKLYDSEVFGADPLGLGFDQAKGLFVAKEAAMMAAGQWYLTDYKDNGGDIDDLGLFLLPVRSEETDTFYTTVMADGFYATPENGENLDEVKAFIDWYFTSQYYADYLSFRELGGTMEGIEVDVPILNEAFDRQELEYVLYDGGNSDFQAIANAIAFDVKRMGQEMLVGSDFDEMMDKLNEDWAKARKNLD